MSGIDPDEKDWRLQAELDVEEPRALLGGLPGRVHERRLAHELKAAVAHDVVVTHDGRLLFAYAADASALASARAAIEATLRDDGIGATVRVSHWDEKLDDWRQTDPPPSAAERASQQASDRSTLEPQTRTLVANVGKEIRVEFEQSLRNWADELGVECEIVEHPHLLSLQVAFKVSGPRRKVDEFVQGLRAEERATIRTDLGVMTSPL